MPSQVLQLPSAAAAPVVNPVLRGRPPKIVRSLTRYRVLRRINQAQEHAAMADAQAELMQAHTGALRPSGSLRDQIESVRFHCRMLYRMAQEAQAVADALMASEGREP